MKGKLKIIWRFVKSLEGIIIILALVSSLVLRLYFGFTDLSFMVSAVGLIISIVIIIKNKFSEISILENRLKEFNVTLDKIINNDITKINQISEEKTNGWKDEMLEYTRSELSKNIGINEEQLVKYATNKYLDLFDFNEVAKRDFTRYLLFSLVYPLENEMNSIINNYTKKPAQDRDKVNFLSYIYAYFIDNKRDVAALFKNQFNYSEDQLTKALFFLKNSLEEVNKILDRINTLKNTEEKNQYLEKLNEEIREYMHTKGASLDKYGEMFLSKLDNAYLIFQQKLGKELKNNLETKKIKNLPLYFTGPYLVISNNIKSSYELKSQLGVDVKPSMSHNLLIVKLLPSDSYISTGLDKKSKKSSKKQLKKIKDVLAKIGELSSTTKHYALILDKPLQDFIESLHYDFLVISKVSQHVKESLREKTNNIKDELKKTNGADISKLTDVYNVSKKDLVSALNKAKVKNHNLDKISEEILKGAKTWRYLLYGYNDGDKND